MRSAARDRYVADVVDLSAYPFDSHKLPIMIQDKGDPEQVKYVVDEENSHVLRVNRAHETPRGARQRLFTPIGYPKIAILTFLSFMWPVP